MTARPGPQQGDIPATQAQQCHTAATWAAAVTARALVVAAPASGSGKTTVATGLMAALRRRGTAVAPFKVGPDYIDPGYHTLAAGRPGRNLDPVLVGADRIAPLARHGAAGAEVAVVEGVMGLFDGRLADGHGSTAEVAGLLGAPVVLVVDTRGQSRSLAALLHGFRSFDASGGPRGGGAEPGRVAPPRGGAARGRGRGRPAGPRCAAPPRRARRAVAPPRAGDGGRARDGGGRGGRRDGRAGGRARRPRRGDGAGPRPPAGPGVVARGRARRQAGPAAARRCARTDRRCGCVFGGQAFTFGYAEHVELLDGGGGRGRGRRPAARHPPPGRHGRARAPRRLPRGARRRALGQRRAAPRGAGARGVRRAGPRRVRRPALPVRDPRRRADVRRPARPRGDDAPAHAGLPRRRRAQPRRPCTPRARG